MEALKSPRAEVEGGGQEGVMVASFISFILSPASILSNHSACLIFFLIYGCGLVSS